MRSIRNFTAIILINADAVIRTIRHWYTALGLMGIQGGTYMISMILALGASTRDVCMGAGRQTDSSRKVTRLAFALYTDRAVSVYDYGSQSDRLGECRCYSVSEIMCCEYVRYFLEAVKIRYSDYL